MFFGVVGGGDVGVTVGGVSCGVERGRRWFQLVTDYGLWG